MALGDGGTCIETRWLLHLLLRDLLALRSHAAGVHWGRRTKPGCTPLLVFQKGKGLPSRAVLDIYKGAGADKSFHKWGQDVYSVQYYLDCFSRLGDLVFDPFCGGGTVPYVCTQIHRRFIAFEIDPTTATIARKRLEVVQPLLLSLERIEQIPLGMEVSA